MSTNFNAVPGEPFVPLSSVRIETENSLWWIVPNKDTPGGKYLRTSKIEMDRLPTPSVNGRLDDGIWHEYYRAVWSNSGLPEGLIRLNLKPATGPEGGYGILTGVVLQMTEFSDLPVSLLLS